MTTKANCILLNVRGKHYYAEEFGKFIEIEKWEYDRILNNPHLYYFSTALKKHFEWCAAVGKATTLTFSDALGQTQSVIIGSSDEETVSPAEPNELSFEREKVTHKPIALLLRVLRETIEQLPMRLTKWTLLSVAIAAVTAFVGYNSRAPNHNVPSYSDDMAEPSPNSVTALNLLRIGYMFDRNDARQRAEQTFNVFAKQLKTAPSSVPQMLVAWSWSRSKPKQIVIAGRTDDTATQAMLHVVHRHFAPHEVLILADGDAGQQFFSERVEFMKSVDKIDNKATAYVCENFICQLPTTDPKKFAASLTWQRPGSKPSAGIAR